MGTAVDEQPQMGLGATVLEDEELLKLCRDRTAAKQAASAARKKADDSHGAVEQRIGQLEIELEINKDDSEIRVGPYTLAMKQGKQGEEVSFEKNPKPRLSIKYSKKLDNVTPIDSKK